MALPLSDPDLLKPSRAERRSIWFPLVGWFIGARMQSKRIRRAMDEVHDALTCRPDFPAAAWADAGVEPALAEKVARGFTKVFDYVANPHLLPDDPLILLSLDEELGMLLVMRAVREGTGVDLRAHHIRPDMTMLDLVRVVSLKVGGA